MLVEEKNHFDGNESNKQKVTKKNENVKGRISKAGPTLNSTISIDDQLDHLANIIVNNILQELKRYEKK